jgi:hypothetical protein
MRRTLLLLMTLLPIAAAESSTRLDPAIQKIVSQISEERIAGIMRKLENFETRHTLSDPTQANRGIGAARQWIFDELKSYSPRLEVQFDTHQIAKTNRVWKEIELRNVVAILPGTMPQLSNRWILVSGHYADRTTRSRSCPPRE